MANLLPNFCALLVKLLRSNFDLIMLYLPTPAVLVLPELIKLFVFVRLA
jgi:hypothetical protein